MESVANYPSTGVIQADTYVPLNFLQPGQIVLKTTSHLFRYASEWDPRQPGHTKGGYLEGSIQLPEQDNLRVVLSTYADTPITAEPQLFERNPEASLAHPLILYVVRKGKGNKRMTEKEPVPNKQHWRQEFIVQNKCVHIVNKTSSVDLKRNVTCSIPDVDNMFMLKKDRVLTLGKGAGELNLIFLIPKTEARAAEEEVTLKKVIFDRVTEESVASLVLANFRGRSSSNIKRVRVKVEIYCNVTGSLLHSSVSSPICDTGSKDHGLMDFVEAGPLSGCANGGKKVLMNSESTLSKEVMPRFLLYGADGDTRLLEEEHLLAQPSSEDVMVSKNTLFFITPPQPNMEDIFNNGWVLKLAAMRMSDGLISSTKFVFKCFPNDFFDPCFHCLMNPDNVPIGPERTGA